MSKETILGYPAVLIPSIYKLPNGTIFLLGDSLDREAYEVPIELTLHYERYKTETYRKLDKEQLTVAKIIDRYTRFDHQEAVVEILKADGSGIQGTFIFRNLDQRLKFWEVAAAVYFGGSWRALSAHIPAR